MKRQHKNIFKSGLLVADIDAAMVDLGRWLELDWTPVRTAELTVRTAAGEEQVGLTFVCATQGDTVLELIQAQPRGYYCLQPGEALHHVGMWVDDLAASSRQLAATGMPLEAAGVSSDQSPALFAFHTNPYGLRIELVDAVMRPAFEQWLSGGELAL